METRGLLLIAAAVVLVSGCHKKPPVKPVPPEVRRGAAIVPASDEAVRKGLPPPKQGERMTVVYFEFDAWALSPDARAVLSEAAEALRIVPDARVRIEGHADERGSTQYNVALGERRAAAAKAYLESLGILAARLETTSFGEERPADPGHDTKAWSANRRVELIVPGSVVRSSSR